MKNKFLSLLMACIMIVGCSGIEAITASADNSVMPATETDDDIILEIIEGDQDPYVKTTRDSYITVSQTLSSTTGSQTISFKPTTDYPYYRIFVSNTGSSTYNITLTDASGANQLKVSPAVLSTGKSTTMRNANAASGMRYLTVTSKDGSALSGRVAIRLASSADELE